MNYQDLFNYSLQIKFCNIFDLKTNQRIILNNVNFPELTFIGNLTNITYISQTEIRCKMTGIFKYSDNLIIPLIQKEFIGIFYF